VKDREVHAEVLEKVRGYVSENGLIFEGEIESPIRGTKGNTEYLMLVRGERI